MLSKSQLTGMTGVYLVAAQLSMRGFVASPTSRSARGADILVTNQHCTRAYSVQVKTNASTFSFWLLSEHAKNMVSDSHIYVLVNLRKSGTVVEYFVVPSNVIAERMGSAQQGKGTWHAIGCKDVKEFENRWDVFDDLGGTTPNWQ